MKKKQRKFKDKFYALYIMQQMLPKFYRTDPVLCIWCFIFSAFHGVSFGVITLLQQRFFDNAAKLVTKEVTFRIAIISLLFMCLGYVISQSLNGVANFLPNNLSEKVRGRISVEIHEKLSRISPVLFEDTKKLDFINKAEEGKNCVVWFVLNFLSIFLFYIPYFIFMAWYLFSLRPILVFSLLFVFIPTLINQGVRVKIFAKVEDQSAPVRRQMDYYEECIVTRQYFKETRLLGAFGYFKNLYMNALDSLQKIRFKATFRTGLIELAVSLASTLGYIGILLLLFDSLMKNEISVGAFAAVFASINMLYVIMDELICRQIGEMSRNFGSIRNYLEFLALEEVKGEDITLPEQHDIILDHVSFSYPEAQQDAVKHASLHIKSGETIAIVGENGSGKSTLIRLIAGLYTPKEGTVLYDTSDISKISFSSLFRNTSAVFQKYQRYQMTLADNIGVSQVDVAIKPESLDPICTMAGVTKDEETYPNGYDTMLSREFDGVDLSGGQWQRVSIARAFFRNHQIIILDEPTAAIDPYEETRIYNQFAEISKDKTSIIVTHRLGSVKLADRVVVMKEGEIVQCGTHDELIAEDGEYAKLYKSQEQWYRSEEI